MSQRPSADFRPARESSLWIVVIVIVALLVAGGFWWRWQERQDAAVEAPTEVPQLGVPDGVPPAEAPAPVATVPQYPVDAAPDPSLPKLDDADARIRSALTELLGGKAVLSFLQIDGFVRRFVATVDNLPRDQAAARMWPVQPTPRRLDVSGSGDATTLGTDNSARYTPFVLFVESVDAKRAADLYLRLYPLFQQAYEELGYPGRYFNDRMVAVIDHLLEAPEPAGPVQLKLVEIKGDSPSQRPFVRYEFADPKLETLSAGQKMLIRAGPVNERRLKARLGELRGLVAGGAPARR